MRNVFLLIILFITVPAFCQPDSQCPKCSYEYMTVIVKEAASGKVNMYISRSDVSEMIVKNLSDISLEQFQYTSMVAVIKDFSKEGWRVLSSNMAFETETTKKTRLYFLLYKLKE